MKTKNIIKRFLAIIIVVAVLNFAACNISVLFPHGVPDMAHRKYVRPDENEAFALIDDIEKLLESDGNLKTIEKKRNEFFNKYYSKALTLATVADLNHYKDVTDAKATEESEFMSEYLNKLQNETIKLEQSILKSPYYGDYFMKQLGEDYALSILSTSTNSPEDLALLSEISQLQSQYDIAYNEGNINEIADIYTSLIIKNNEYARRKKDKDGNYYDNYLDYAYAEIYGREYTPKDARVFKNNVKSYIRPIAITLSENLSDDYLISPKVNMNNIKKYLPKVIDATLPNMKKSWDYMMEKDLYDFDRSPNKANMSFVTEFYEYGDAFMFINPTGYLIDDLSTLIHEFGHYNEVFMADPELGNGNMNYDLAETHSQCFELLTLDPLKPILLTADYGKNAYGADYGEKVYNSYLFNELFNATWAILSNCAFDEFEYLCYTNAPENLNTQFYNTAFHKTLTDYWIIDNGINYYDVPHLFSSPAYCISYSVSMTFSAEIWASEDPINNYSTVVRYGTENSLNEVCKAINLPSPLLPESVQSVGRKFQNSVNELFGLN